MNYFDYNRQCGGGRLPRIEPGDVLEFTGHERIEVSEDRSLTLDEIREYLRQMRRQGTRPPMSGFLSGANQGPASARA